jgi:hypothetical protein
MSAELAQTLVNAVLLIGVTLIAGSLGLKRFEAIDRRFEASDQRIDRRFDRVDRQFGALDERFDALERSVRGSVDELRNEFKHDIALVDTHVGEARAELAQTRSDLTYVALAVGARRAEGSG